MLLHRSRTATALPALTVAWLERGLEIAFPRGWLAAHPLTAVDLAQEQDYLSRDGLTLRCGPPGACPPGGAR